MTERLITRTTSAALPVRAATKGELDVLEPAASRWARTTRFAAGAGSVLVVPGENGEAAGAVLGLGSGDGVQKAGPAASLLAGALATELPDGDWRLEEHASLDASLSALAFLLGGYRFERYRSTKKAMPAVRLAAGEAVDAAAVGDIAAGVVLARDLINTPANDMGPAELEAAARALAGEFGATVETVEGDALLSANFPLIHAVGRASASAPRLIEMRWGPADAPKVTLVGKGVCFDTGGLDIKNASGMLLMKKDMGGAANVLGLARIVMARRLHLRLRVLIPAVENAISGTAFRPSDVLASRKGRSVEIGNTDAEGRLVVADALTLGDEEAPEVMIDMATLTGAARVALGPDLPPFYTDDELFAASLADASARLADPLWRLPLWQPYARNLSSKVADLNNTASDSFAGSITAALFLQGFVEKAGSWCHLDIYGWRPKASPIGPVGGEAQGIRALFDVLAARYPAR